MATPSAPKPSIPAVIDLGRRLAALSFEQDRQDQAALDARDNKPARSAARRAMKILDQQSQALRELVTTLPARSIADAAVQVAEAYGIAENLEINVHSAEEVEQLSAALIRLILSALPLIVKAAGLDPVAMGWGQEVGSLYASRFAGLEGVA